MSSAGLEMSMSREFNRVDPPRRTPRDAAGFPSRNVARGACHVPPTPRPIACSHGSPRRRSALAWDEAEASEHNQSTARPPTSRFENNVARGRAPRQEL